DRRSSTRSTSCHAPPMCCGPTPAHRAAPRSAERERSVVAPAAFPLREHQLPTSSPARCVVEPAPAQRPKRCHTPAPNGVQALMGAHLSLAEDPDDRSRDEEAAISFEVFFADTHVALFRALTLVTGNRQEAEDVMQVAFMKVFERWDRVCRMENPQGFLYRVAMNEFRSRYRRAKRAVRRAVTSSSDTEAFEEAIEDRDVVIRALRELVPRQRAAIVLTALLEYSSEEAGEILGIDAATVRTLGSRARASMRKTVGDRT